MRECGGNCQKYHERGWNRTEGTGHKDLKRGRQAGSRGGFLKKGGLEPPYKLCHGLSENKNILCTAFLRKRLEFQAIKKIPINLIINYCMVFNWHCRGGSNETRVAISGENVFYSIHHQFLVSIHVTFVPEIICAVGEQV